MAVGKSSFFLVQGGVACGCGLSREVLALLGGSFPVTPVKKDIKKGAEVRRIYPPILFYTFLEIFSLLFYTF